MSGEKESGDGVELDKLLRGLGDKLDSCLRNMETMSGGMETMSGRLDALEKRNKSDDDEPERKGEARRVAADEASPAYVNEMTAAQAKADSAFASWGERAPKWVEGETLLNFRRRLCRAHQKHSPKFQGSDLDTVTDAKIFAAVEDQIFADSISAAMRPDSAPVGMLREVTRVLPSGHRENTFVGHPSAWMNQFSGRRAFVARIATPQEFHRGFRS